MARVCSILQLYILMSHLGLGLLAIDHPHHSVKRCILNSQGLWQQAACTGLFHRYKKQVQSRERFCYGYIFRIVEQGYYDDRGKRSSSCITYKVICYGDVSHKPGLQPSTTNHRNKQPRWRRQNARAESEATLDHMISVVG